MTEKDRMIESKEERQKTMDKLSIKSGRAYTYNKEKEDGSGCVSNARSAIEKTQQELNR